MELQDLQARIWRRLGENPLNPQWWTAAEVTAALNWMQRLFVLLTLCLEDQRELVLTPGSKFYHMLEEPNFTDWLMPLRIRLSNDPRAGLNSEWGSEMDGAFMPGDRVFTPPMASSQPKLQPSRLDDLDRLSDTFLTDTGTPGRYALVKTDLLILDKATTVDGTSLLVNYARQPLPLVNPTDVPDIPTIDHSALADGAVVILRLKDGGQELAKAKSLLESFVDAATRRADHVRARSRASQYDSVPFEISRFDWSRLFGRRKDLPPSKQADPWPTSVNT